MLFRFNCVCIILLISISKEVFGDSQIHSSNVVDLLAFPFMMKSFTLVAAAASVDSTMKNACA